MRNALGVQTELDKCDIKLIKQRDQHYKRFMEQVKV